MRIAEMVFGFCYRTVCNLYKKITVVNLCACGVSPHIVPVGFSKSALKVIINFIETLDVCFENPAGTESNSSFLKRSFVNIDPISEHMDIR